MFEPSAPAGTLNLAKYCPVEAAASIADVNSAVELYAGYGKTVYTALATVAGNVVGIVATKGAEDVLCRNCVSKAARFVRLCDAFSIPVVTLVNTDGFVKSASDDMAGGLREAARLAGTYADATTAKVAVITGKAVGVAYTALANADLTIAVEGCTVAPLDPKAAVTVLYKDELENGTNMLPMCAAPPLPWKPAWPIWQCPPQACAPPLYPRWICFPPSAPSVCRRNTAT